MLTDFQNSFTGRLTGKFATNSYLNIPAHLKYVATLPCEIWMLENWQQSEICIVINDKSQDSTAKHLSYDGLLDYTNLSVIVSVKDFLKSVNIWQSYRQNGWYAPLALRHLSSKMQNSLDKLNNLFITDRNCYWLLLC